ncbi:MAG: hypothetical protein QXF23_03540 [Candidatus Bathyarchaeia archaeon]
MSVKRIFSLILVALLLADILLLLNPVSHICAQDKRFAIISVIARSSIGSPKIYPGSRRVNLRIEAMYIANKTAFSVVGHLNTTKGIEFSYGSGPSALAKSLEGSVLTSVKEGDHVLFEYYLDIDKTLSPGTYPLQLNITYLLEGSSEILFELHSIEIEVSHYPEVQLRFIEAYLNPASYPGSVNTNLYVVLENSGESSIASATFRIDLPYGFTINNPRASIGVVNVGERFTLRFSGISIPQNAAVGVYSAVISADLSMRTEDNVYYNSTESISIQFSVTEAPREDPIIVSSISVLYQGSPAPLLPSAKGVTIRISFVNRLPEAVGGMVIIPDQLDGINVRSLSGTYVNGMPPGGSCFVDITVDVNDGVRPGKINIPLKVFFVRIVSDSSFLGRQDVSVDVIIESPHGYLPEVSLVSAYWGYPTPSPVYAKSRYAPLTLRLINNGRYSIVGAVIEASSNYLKPIKSSETLAARLAPGSYSEVTLYFDVGADAGEIPLNVQINYVFSEFGTHIEVAREFTVHLVVEEYPAAASYLEIVGYGWQNNYNVFPRTDNATFQVTIANRAPFPISGIILHLILPENMSSRGERSARAYVDGPVRSLSTFTATFLITVGGVKPGRHVAKLIVDFILQSGGPGERCSESFSLDISINDDSNAVEFVSASWYEGSVGPYTYGARLLISVRNNLVDNMRGAVLEIRLPKGFVSAVDNSSLVRAPPSTISPLPTLPQLPFQVSGTILEEYLRVYQPPQEQVSSRGDILTFIVPLHILDVDLGLHNFMGNLSYIDQWGTRRTVGLIIPVAVLGRTVYVDVRIGGNINVKSRFTNTSLTIENRGTSPLHDVYLIVSPYQGMPLLIASPAVTYIERIDAGKKVDIPLTLIYNPFGFITQVGGTTVVTYGPVPLITSIIYRDASGAVKRLNNTVTVVVEPFIDILVRDINAVGKRSSSMVSGVIANLGSATAYRVRVVLKAGGTSSWTLVGDVAPADELAFRIEVPEYSETCSLIIEYYDAFNQLFSKEITVKIEPQPETPTIQPQEGALGVETWIVVGAVIVFLAIALVLIYRALKARSMK